MVHLYRHPAGFLSTICARHIYTARSSTQSSSSPILSRNFTSKAPGSPPTASGHLRVKLSERSQRLRSVSGQKFVLIGGDTVSQVSPKVTTAAAESQETINMPRRGFGKKKGGYKGPVPGPEGAGDGNEQQNAPSQKPAKKPPLTHFLCVPLVTAESRSQLRESLGKFKADVVRPRRVNVGVNPEAEQEHGPEVGDEVGTAQEASEQEAHMVPDIPEKAIRPVGTLHLTLGVMSLMTPERVQEAVSLLQGLDLAAMLQGRNPARSQSPLQEDISSSDAGGPRNVPQIEETQTQGPPRQGLAQSGEVSLHDATSGNSAVTASDLPPDSVVSGPLVISLKSLVSMHPPGKTSILYAQPEDPTNRLHPFCDALRTLFTEKGLMVEDTRPLKLHATVINTIYAKAGGRHGKGHGKGRGFSGKARDPIAGGSATAAGETTTIDTLPSEASIAPPDTSSGHGPNARAPIRIDATHLLPRYADFVWAEGIHVGKVAICKMGAKKIVGERGDVIGEEYEQVAAAEIKL